MGRWLDYVFGDMSGAGRNGYPETKAVPESAALVSGFPLHSNPEALEEQSGAVV